MIIRGLIVLLFLFLFFPLLTSFVSASTSQVYFLHTDHLGSIVAVSDENGKVVSTSKNYPYGDLRNLQPTTDNLQPVTERGYTGQIRDDSSNLMYYNARYYNSQLAIFTQPDPVGGINKYAYAAGNPIRFTDPSGNMVADPGGGGGGGETSDNQPPFSYSYQPLISSSYTSSDTISYTEAYASGVYVPPKKSAPSQGIGDVFIGIVAGILGDARPAGDLNDPIELQTTGHPDTIGYGAGEFIGSSLINGPAGRIRPATIIKAIGESSLANTGLKGVSYMADEEKFLLQVNQLLNQRGMKNIQVVSLEALQQAWIKAGGKTSKQVFGLANRSTGESYVLGREGQQIAADGFYHLTGKLWIYERQTVIEEATHLLGGRLQTFRLLDEIEAKAASQVMSGNISARRLLSNSFWSSFR